MTRARDLSNLIGSGNYSQTTLTATAGQTSFTVSHTPNFVQVFMNGLLLDPTVDFTANGTAIVLTEAAAVGDELEVVTYETFSVGDAITQTEADTRYVLDTADVITVSGSNVGIGTANPSEAIHALGGKIKATNGADTVYQLISADNNGGVLQTGSNAMRFFTSGSERMRLDSSGNVGMGTGVPDSLQTLQDDSSTLGPLLTFKNQYRSGSTTADYMGGIAFSAWRDISPTKSYAAGIYAINDGFPGTSANLVFKTSINGGTDPYSAGIERMRIDSSGRVTKPYQPLFSASDTRALIITSSVLTSANCFNSIDYNVGNHFNSSNGRFTAPVAGYYDCSVHIADASSTGREVNIRIRKNGNSNTGPLAEGYNQTSIGSTNVFIRCIVQLNVGDYIDFEAAKLNTVSSIQHKRFIIHMLG